MQPVLAARGLVKDYRRTRAVDGVDITVGAGERVALLGPNGAGKTTTLLMVLGAITPDAGEVEICGVRQREHRSRAAEHIGFAAGYLPLAGEMRVREYLTMYGRIYGIPDPQPAIAEGLERFHIEPLAEAMGSQLSSGQRTLVGIVRAFLHRPRLLVLDEPTASLDPDVAQRVRSGILELCADHTTALLVTSHDMREVEMLSERVLFLARGRVVADGRPEEIAARFEREDLEGVFLHLADAGRPAPEPEGGQHTDFLR
ncbi:MAG: ABC transporter ATP-binding protein [Actinomycetes bacterium]